AEYSPEPGRLAVGDGYVYLPQGYDVQIIDVNEPTQPQLVGYYPLDYIVDVEIMGDLAYMARQYDNIGISPGLYILDISDPLQPIEIGSYTDWRPWHIQVRDDLAFCSTSSINSDFGHSGFGILDVSDPQEPVEVATLSGFWSFDAAHGDVAISESWAYRGGQGIKVINIIDPNNPELITTMPGNYAVTYCGQDNGKDLMCVRRKLGGLYSNGVSFYRNDILLDPVDIEQPETAVIDDFFLSQNYPNPVMEQTTISYRLPQADWVDLSVYTITGQLVRTLIEARQASGEYAVTWDGTDARDQTVPAGVYLYCLKTSRDTETRRMIIVQ
ncbi:MAG: T9SS type A sorting domain-containing protein, partial [Planctomycetes bacterium]|nr:T9SS type A sorting domain-containing protein [Planctomycetota bacterium]